MRAHFIKRKVMFFLSFLPGQKKPKTKSNNLFVHLFHWCVKYHSSTDQKCCLASLYLSHLGTLVTLGIYTAALFILAAVWLDRKTAQDNSKNRKEHSCSEASSREFNVTEKYQHFLGHPRCFYFPGKCFPIELCIQGV